MADNRDLWAVRAVFKSEFFGVQDMPFDVPYLMPVFRSAGEARAFIKFCNEGFITWEQVEFIQVPEIDVGG